MSDFVSSLRGELVAAAEREERRRLPALPPLRPLIPVLVVAAVLALAAIIVLPRLGGEDQVAKPPDKTKQLFGGTVTAGERLRTSEFFVPLELTFPDTRWIGQLRPTQLSFTRQYKDINHRPDTFLTFFRNGGKFWDPRHPDREIPVPRNLLGFLASHPDITARPARPTTLAGHRARVMDYRYSFRKPLRSALYCEGQGVPLHRARPRRLPPPERRARPHLGGPDVARPALCRRGRVEPGRVPLGDEGGAAGAGRPEDRRLSGARTQGVFGHPHAHAASSGCPGRPSAVFPFFADAGTWRRSRRPGSASASSRRGPIEMRAGTLIEYRLKLHAAADLLADPDRGVGCRACASWTYSSPGRTRSGTTRTSSRPTADGGTLMRDTVRYALPFGPLGEVAHRAVGAARPRARSSPSATRRWRGGSLHGERALHAGLAVARHRAVERRTSPA